MLQVERVLSRSAKVPFLLPFKDLSIPLQHADEGVGMGVLRVAAAADAEQWAKEWQPVLRRARGRHPELGADAEWDWAKEIRDGATVDGRLAVALRRGTALEGLMSLSFLPGQTRLDPDKGRDLLYIEYVGVAPANQRAPVGDRKIKGIGKFLVRIAATLSVDLGLDGRVGLHSKDNATDFYEHNCGFTPLGVEACDDGDWMYFEIDAEGAKLLMKDGA